MAHKPPSVKSSSADVQAFLSKVSALPQRAGTGRGRLIFAMDATASRQPSWDQAMDIQADMFAQAAALGGLDVQLAWYRGQGEFEASSWTSAPDHLLRVMRDVDCRGGLTQIETVLRHAVAETRRTKVNALVFVGDCVEENVDRLCAAAGEMGLLGLPAFLFHEGNDPAAEQAFRQIARLSGGACCAFDANSPEQLRDLLRAVAVYAAGGRKALADYSQRRGGMALTLVRLLPGR